MKKLYDKAPVWFAVAWIAVYVLGFGNADNLSLALGMPKVLTVAVGLALSVIAFCFIRANGLQEYFGLCKVKRPWKELAYFLPLLPIALVNLVCGFQMPTNILAAVLGAVSMCFVGFLEEVIFRGFLFKAMSRDNVKTAFIVSSVTFGAGHIVNLIMGAPVGQTLLQLVYATAAGFCFTAVFYAGGSLLPCIAAHIIVNVTSVFIQEPSREVLVLTALAQTVISLGYGFWLLRKKKN